MIRSVLVPIDGSELSEGIFAPIQPILRAQGVWELTVVRVLEGGGGDAEDPRYAEAYQALQGLQRRLGDEKLKVNILVERGDPAERILAVVERSQPDLVAMASHGRTGLGRLLRGSVAERVLRHCPAPLLLCNPRSLESREDPTRSFMRILVPLDGSRLAREILPLVETMARFLVAQVILLGVEEEASLGGARRIKDALEEDAARLREAGMGKVRVIASAGVPAEQILQAAELQKVDLVAMSTHGRTGVSRWRFGSVAEAVLRQCACPTLVLRVGGGE